MPMYACVCVCVPFHTAVILGASTQHGINRQSRLTPKHCALLWISYAHTHPHKQRNGHTCMCVVVWQGKVPAKVLCWATKVVAQAVRFYRCVSLCKYVGLKVDRLFGVGAWKSAKSSVICSAKRTKQSVWHTLGLNCSLHTKFLTILP